MDRPLNLKKLADSYSDDDRARELLEKTRWPEGPVCPHCGQINNAYRLQARAASKTPVRKGVWKCGGCREQFSVTVGTVFEDSHVSISKWLLAIHLLCASKKGMSAHQLHRMIGVSYKTAWFMFHRLRFSMAQHPWIDKLGGVIEIDETYIGPKEKGIGGGKPTIERSKKRPVVSLLDRERGQVRSFPVERVTVAELKPILKENVETRATIQTDEAVVYHFMRDEFPQHDVVKHRGKEYSRWENGRHITTNTVEGFFSLVKRGVYGTYHHIGIPYLQQYLNEFDFRYNSRKMSDGERAVLAIRATEAKRLLLHRPSGNPAA